MQNPSSMKPPSVQLLCFILLRNKQIRKPTNKQAESSENTISDPPTYKGQHNHTLNEQSLANSRLCCSVNRVTPSRNLFQTPPVSCWPVPYLLQHPADKPTNEWKGIKTEPALDSWPNHRKRSHDPSVNDRGVGEGIFKKQLNPIFPGCLLFCPLH